MKSSRDNHSHVEALKLADAWVLIQALLCFMLVVPGLRIFGFKRVARLLGLSIVQMPNQDIVDQECRANRIAYLVSGISIRLPLHSTCLARSLVLWRLLMIRGIHSQVCIGINKRDKNFDSFSAHAWVEYRGRMLIEEIDKENLFGQIAVFSSLNGSK